MAENIDELQIEIKVKENKSAQKIDAITLAVNNLTAALSELNKFSNVLDNLAKMKISDVAKNVKDAIDGKTPSLDTKDMALNEGNTNIFPRATEKISKDEFSAKLAELKEKISTVASQMSELNPKMEQLQETAIQTGFAFEDMGDDIKNAGKDLDNSKEKVKKSTSLLAKLARAVGRISVYRAIRTVLKGIVDAGKQGLGNLRGQNKELDESLNKISLAGTSLKNSFASMLAPIIQSVEPFITKLADGIARIVNRFTEAKAVMSGMSTYTKILTSDMTEYEKQVKKATGSLLEFDTFTTLNNKDTYTGVTTEKTTMTPEEAQSLTEKLQAIKTIVEGIGAALALWAITKFLKDIKDLSGVLGSITKGAGIAFVIATILDTIRQIKDLVDNWDTKSVAQRFKSIMSIILTGLAAIFGVLALIPALTAWAAPAAIGAAVGAIYVNSLPAYATGGDFQTADLFYANENGQTELIASSNSGGGAVMNMEQLRSAIYEGMVMAMSDSGDKEITLKVDQNTLGRVVAQSSGFINETNRRNAGLRLI